MGSRGDRQCGPTMEEQGLCRQVASGRGVTYHLGIHFDARMLTWR
ncbi:hypothetical protein A3768_4660 (plasmid) [Ralstonia solanacearum]|nr:hypothetical protein A3768_4660 [Ralstonia solanacearum]